jgi:hypothetical protein
LDKHCAAGAARTPKAARRAEGRMPGVKKGRSAPAEGDETGESLAGRRACPPAVAKPRKSSSKIKMDPGFRRDDEQKHRIRASAGITSNRMGSGLPPR